MYFVIPANCTFNESYCGWRNVLQSIDQFNWYMRTNGTPSHGTGPSSDHTGTLNVFQNSHCVSSWAFSASKMAGRAGRGGAGVETSWQDFQNTPTILKQRFQISNKQTRQSIASTILQKHQNTFPWVSSPGPPFKSGEFPWVEVGVLFRLWVNVLRVMTE